MNKSKTKKKNGVAPVVEPTEAPKPSSEVDVNGEAEPKGDAPLNEVEEFRLAEFEKVVKLGLGGFMIAGKALKAIRDQRLYRAKFKTFEDYCRERWDLSDKYAYRLMDAYTVVDHLERELKTSPNGEIRLPANESQVRPLMSLESKHQTKAWQQVLKHCVGKPITADEVQAVVDEMGHKPPTNTPKPKTALKKANTKLTKIDKWVTETLEEDDSKLTVASLKKVLEKIRELIGAKK